MEMVFRFHSLLSDESTVLIAPDSHSFPPPWSIEERTDCFTVRDASGQSLGFFYYEEESSRRSAAKLPTKYEAQLIAASFAKLPELLRNFNPR
jgi:hypothetical protein